MALVIDFIKVAQSRDNMTVAFQDKTGDYDSDTNPTGYGTPFAVGDVLRTIIEVTNLKTGLVTYSILTQDDAQDVAAKINLLELNSLSTGQTQSGEDLEELTDGTYQIKYMPVFTESITVGATNGSLLLTGTNLTTALANYEYIYISGFLYEIDKVNNFTPTSVKLKSVFTGTTGSYSAQSGPSIVLKFGLNGIMNAKMVSAIGHLNPYEKIPYELFVVFFNKLGSDANEQYGDFLSYQKSVDVANSFFKANKIKC